MGISSNDHREWSGVRNEGNASLEKGTPRGSPQRCIRKCSMYRHGFFLYSLSTSPANATFDDISTARRTVILPLSCLLDSLNVCPYSFKLPSCTFIVSSSRTAPSSKSIISDDILKILPSSIRSSMARLLPISAYPPSDVRSKLAIAFTAPVLTSIMIAVP